MASLEPENWGSVDGGDAGDEFPEIDGTLITSLLDEPYGGGGGGGGGGDGSEENEERLKSVMQSLEAEISPGNVVSGQEDEFGGKYGETCYYEGGGDMEQMDGLNCCISTNNIINNNNNVDFDWIGMEVEPSLSIDGLTNNWYVDHCRDDGMGSMTQDYSHFNYEIALEEEEEEEGQGYGSSLWHC